MVHSLCVPLTLTNPPDGSGVGKTRLSVVISLGGRGHSTRPNLWAGTFRVRIDPLSLTSDSPTPIDSTF